MSDRVKLAEEAKKEFPSDMSLEVQTSLEKDLLVYGTCFFEKTKTEAYKVVIGTKNSYKRIAPENIEQYKSTEGYK